MGAGNDIKHRRRNGDMEEKGAYVVADDSANVDVGARASDARRLLAVLPCVDTVGGRNGEKASSWLSSDCLRNLRMGDVSLRDDREEIQRLDGRRTVIPAVPAHSTVPVGVQ